MADNNEMLQQEVYQALQWEKMLHASGIGVSAKDGVVTLFGSVASTPKKARAEEVVKKVAGVCALVKHIGIRNACPGIVSDNKIALQVMNALKWNTEISAETIHVKVESGWVTLSGEVAWNRQKEAAKKAIINLIGVRGVINEIAIRPNPGDVIHIANIMAALGRSGSVNAKGIHLESDGHTAILLGTIDSWYEKEEAARIVWNAPGVTKVDNRLEVKYSREFD